jgi:hypothetical protein
MTTLQQKMVQIAEPIVKHYWSDVTDHDFPAVEMMLVGEARLWALRKTGTWLCSLAQDKDAKCDFQGIVGHIIKNPEHNDGERNFFILHKTSENDGTITPISVEEMSYVNI